MIGELDFDAYELDRFPGPTTRLAKNGFEWGLPPRSQRQRDKWEREADLILGAAYARLGKTGAMTYGAEGNHVWSLDQYEEQHGEFGGPDLILGHVGIDPVDDVVAVATSEAGLSHSEARIVAALAEGAPSGVLGWTEPLAARFGKTPNTIRVTWSHAKRKLRARWAEEPLIRPVRDRPRSGMCGDGERVFIGQPRSWGPRITPEDAAEAMSRHWSNPIRNSDWRYERSLTEDGWQLGDDNLWSDWTPRWLA